MTSMLLFVRVEEINEVLKLYHEVYKESEAKNLFVVFDDFLGRNKFDVEQRILQDIGNYIPHQLILIISLSV